MQRARNAFFNRSLPGTLVVALSLVSCGFDSSEDDSFSANANSDTANNRSSSDAAANKDDLVENDEGQDCEGVHLHGGHETCDSDDLEVIKEKDPKGDENGSEETNPEGNGKDPNANNGGKTEDPIVKPGTDPVIVPGPAKDPNIVEFRIKAGTGSGGWNTQNEMIAAKVGQTIRVFNDDTIVHRLHTANNAPCAHGVNIPVGGSKDCVVGKAFDSTNSNAVYDHIVGPSAKIWIKAQ